MFAASKVRSWMFLLSAVLLAATPARAAAFASAGSGNWNNPATWGGSIPGAGDDVTINDGDFVTVTDAQSAATVTLVGSIATGATTLSIQTGGSLSVSGAVTLAESGFVNKMLEVAGGSLSCASIDLIGGFNGGDSLLRIGNGTATVNGDVKVPDPANSMVLFNGTGSLVVNGSLTGSGQVDISSGGTLHFAGSGTFLNTGTFTSGSTSTVRYSGNGQAVRAALYGKLVVDGPNVILAGNTNANDFTVAAGGFLTAAGFTLQVTRDLTADGFVSGTGLVTVSGSTGTITGAGAGGIMPSVVLNSHQITGSVLFGGSVSLLSGTTTIINSGTTDIDLNLDGPAGSQWVNAAGSSLKIGGHVLSGGITIDASANPNTVTFDGASQNVAGNHSFWDLIFTGSALKSTATSTNVANDLTISGTATLQPQDDLSIGGDLLVVPTATLDGNGVWIGVGGNWTSNNKFVPNGAIASFNGASLTQSIDQTSFASVEFSNAALKVFTGSATIGGPVNITPGATVNGGASLSHFVAGDWINSGTFVPNTSTITFNGAVTQSVGATPFYNLSVDGNGILFSGNSSVSNLFHVISGNANVDTGTLTINGLDLDPLTSIGFAGGLVQISGNIVTDGAFSGSGTVLINGTAIQSWSGTNQSLSNLTINKPSGSLNPSIDLTITGTMTMTQGAIVLTSPATLYVSSGQLTHTSGHVNGRLKITANSGTELFPFGTTLGDSFVTATVGPGDTIDMEIVQAAHPANTGGNSDLLQTFWRVHAVSVAIFPTLDFAWPLAAVNGVEGDYIVGFWDGAAWAHPPSSVNATTHTASVASANPIVGDWTVGAPASLGAAVSFTITTDGAADAGVPESITITAQDSLGNTASTYTGAHTLVFTGANAAPDGTLPSAANSTGIPVDFGTGTALSFAAGVATTDLRLYRAETAALGVSESAGPATTGTFDIVVTAGPMAAIEISDVNGAAPLYANAPFSVDVSAVDAYGNPTSAPTDTNVTLALNCAGCTGTLSGTTNGTLLNGTGVVTLTPLQYSVAQSGVVIRANTDAYGFADTAPLTFATQVAGFVVTNASDAGTGSLREVLTNVNAGLCVSPCPVTFNIGSGPQTITPASALPPIEYAIQLDATSQPGYAGTPLIFLNGAAAGATSNGLEVTAAGSTIEGFAIGNFAGAGIRIETSTSVIRANWIGLGLDGATAAPNGAGILVIGDANTIGGTLAADRNVISGNTNNGITLTGSSAGNSIRGNYIGTSASGTSAVPNAFGIALYSDANSNTIGGGAAGDRNVISGNSSSGIVLKGSTLLIEAVTKDASGRKISSNPVVLDGTAQANSITGNYIGVASNGLTPLGNSVGVEFNARAKDNDLGLAGAGNVISGNGRAIVLNDATTTGNRIRANLIGVGSDGITPVPNSLNAIEITASTANTIGGSAAEGNTIANNGGIGISVAGGIGNRFLGNSVFANGGAGIDLNANGADAQDDINGDADAGANGTQNYGVISAATITGTTLDVTVSVNSSATAAQTLLVEVFEADASGEGRTPLGSTCFVGNTLANNVVSMPAGTVIAGDPIVTTVTAYLDSTCSTVGDGTSEFSPAFLAAACTPPPVTFTAPSTVCASSSGNSASVPATAGATYVWTLTNGTIDSGQGTNAITFTAGNTGSVGISVTATSSTGCVASNSTTATIAPLPDATITAPASACSLSSGNIASAPALAGATYNWTITNGTIDSGQGTDAITFTAGSTGSVALALTVTSTSGCTSSGSATVSITPTPDATITAPVSACASATGLTASVPAVTGATYAWSITNGTITGGAGTASITFTAGSTGTTSLAVTVTANGCSSSDTHAVTIAANPTAVIAAPATVCEATGGHAASVPAQAGATYSWTIVNGTIDSDQGTEAITFTAGSVGTTSLSVTVTTGSCTTTGSQPVTVTPKPDATIAATDPICALSSGNVASVTSLAGATYVWTIVNGTITGGNGTDSIVFTAGSTGTVQLGVTVTKDGCSNSGSKSITLKPAPNATIAAPTSADPDSTLTATVPAQAGATYAWSVSNGSIGSGQGTNAISFGTASSGTTTLSVTVTLNGCSKSDTHAVTINDPTPVEAALSLSKTATSSVEPNGTIVYTIAVTNAGPSDAPIVLVKDPVPTETPIVAIHASGWSCGWLLTGLECSAPVTAGTTRSFSIVVKAPSTDGSVTNSATLTSSVDTTPNDNSASATTVVGSGGCEQNGAPVILTPAQGAAIGSPVTISWTSVAGAIDYRVHAQPAGQGSIDLGTTGGATEMTATLPPGNVSVTVDAIFAGCTDRTSQPVSFAVVSAGPCGHRTTATPLAPPANFTATTAATHFEWTPANDPDGYRLWFAVDGGTPAVLGTTVDETSFDGILPAGAIEWWVEALYDGCASTESPHGNFVVPASDACSSAVPMPVTPAYGSSTSHGEVMFSWTPVDGALAYELWLSVDHGTPTLMDTTEGTMLQIIVPDGDLEWFVRAVLDRCPARDSVVARFTYEPPAGCAASLRPIAISPVTRSHVTSPVDFSWTPVQGASGYQLFSIRGDGEPELIASTSASFADDIALPNGKMRWFVRALFSGCTPLDSGEEKLQVVPTPAACSPLETPQIAAIGQVSSGVPFAIQWSPAPGATRYQLQISGNAEFAGAETIETVAPIHHLTRTNAGNDLTPIYARVRAIDDRCATPAMTPFSFIAGIWVLPVDGVEGSAPTTGDDVLHTIQLGPELKGQTFVATAKESWLKIEPASGIVAEGGTTLVVTADVSTLPVGTTLGSVTVAFGDGSVARTPASNATTFNFSTITVGKVTPITPTPKSTPPPDALIIPAVAHATGINSQFQSDVRLTNSSARTMQYQLTFTPSGESGIAVGKQTIFTVDPGRTVALDDVLRSWFGTGNQSVTGSLEIRPLTQVATSTSSAALTGIANRFTFAASRTFNTTPNGSFGQFIPAVPFANFVGRAAAGTASNVLSLQQIAQSDRYRTNLGLLEGSGEPASLLVKVFGQGGQVLKEFPVQLAGGQHLQLNSFLVTNGVGTLDDGRVEVSVVSPGGKVTAYASVLDNATSDPLLVTPVTLTDTGHTKWVIPGVADLQNSAANWQTDMRLFNAGTADVESTLSFYSQNGGAPQVRTVTIPAGQVVQFDRTLTSLFGLSNDGGAVHIATATPARLIATARTYNQTTGGTYGQFISAVTPAETAALNTRPLQILQVEETARFRSNIGIAEVLGNAATVEIAVTPPDAKFTAVTHLQLQPNEFRQLTSLLRSVGLADTYNARVSVRVIDGTGGVTAYASVIDMATNDPTYVPAQ